MKKSMFNNRFLIIGANGQDGKILFDILKQIPGNLIFKIDKRDIDITNFQAVKRLCLETGPTHIIYLAAAHASSETMNTISYTDMEAVNYIGIKNFIDACERLNITPWSLYPTSSKLYPSRCEISETTIPEPNCEYGYTKSRGSLYVLENTQQKNRF